MSLPLVSVLMTSFNREKYIGQAIESVLASTYVNFELLIVDDKSNDRTVEIAKKYETKDKRIKIFENKSNLGQFKNRNYAASLAKGEYIKYVDSDDMIYPFGLELLVYMMEKFPEAGFGLCSLVQDDKCIYPFQLIPAESFHYNYKYKSIFHKAPLSSIIRRSSFLEINGFEIEAVAGDFAFWLKIASFYPVVLMPDGIVWYREHAGGEMEKARKSAVITFEYLKVEELYLRKLTVLANNATKKLLASNRKKQIHFLLSLIKHFKLFEFLEVIKIFNKDPFVYFVEKNKIIKML